MSLTTPHRALVLTYGSLLATVAGFVNAVAILTLAIPVANVTATTTQLGMDAASPWMFETSLLVAIILGFMMGAASAGAVLAPAKTHAGVRHSAIMAGEALLLLLAFAWSGDLLSVFLAALACGLQNGTSSSLRTMQIRTTHFTGTVTDLGLLIGRARRHRFDHWRAAVLSATVVTFITGSVAGTILGSRLGEAALLLPAAVCVLIALAGLAYDRRRHLFTPPPESGSPTTTDRDEPELQRSDSSSRLTPAGR
ncbi:YoaK family protein [Nocardia wallacei]|uniref:YoaK family protein n=1 Tax=Nocardia wallacei TaxID=480035 RepID=UPI0024570CA9|nr:YoaK family protein [Nocardia wallacei]